MNISYHYYTIKTLAVKAGFSEKEAQIIAFYSQMVDDFVLSNKVIVDRCPPNFFLQNGLARKIAAKQWEFLPCPTGIDFVKSVSDNFERHTLAAFHFMPREPLPCIEQKQDFSRMDYRCRKAELSEDMLIVRLLRKAADQVKKVRNYKNLMRLGITLHTFADTYAHCNFSGLHGYENEAVIKSAVKYNGKSAANELDIVFFKDLPMIGHGNIGTIPDICTYRISYAMRSDANKKLDYIVTRSNAEHFSECSRTILNVLCGITGTPVMSDKEWEKLKKDLITAQTVEKDETKYLQPSWQKVFPDIAYDYDRKKDFQLQLEVSGMDSLLRGPAVSLLQDAFSYEGNMKRNSCTVRLKSSSNHFYNYNELAYRQVKEVTGEYSAGAFSVQR